MGRAAVLPDRSTDQPKQDFIAGQVPRNSYSNAAYMRMRSDTIGPSLRGMQIGPSLEGSTCKCKGVDIGADQVVLGVWVLSISLFHPARQPQVISRDA